MNYFYFNECIPRTESYMQYTVCLENSLREYYKLKSKHQSIDGIVTEKQPADIGLCSNFTLKDCILSLKDRDLKRLALKIFTKFPIESFMSDEHTNKLLENEYKLEINHTSYDALNLALTSLCGGILFTLALHEDLSCSPLPLYGNQGDSILLENLYGTSDNSDYLSTIISEKENANATNLVKLKAVLGECKFSDRFEKEFESMSFAVQQAILEHFQRAKIGNWLLLLAREWESLRMLRRLMPL